MAHKTARKRRHTPRKRRRVSGDQSLAPSIIAGTRRKRKSYHPVKRHKRRSRIGAMDSTMNTIMGLAAGVVGGLAISKFAPASIKGKMLSGGKAVIGGFVAYKGKNKPFVLGLGLGLAANGLTDAAHDFGVVQGLEDMAEKMGIGAGSDTMTIEMNGTPENAGRMMSGSNMEQPPILSGEYMSGEFMSGMPSVIADI